MRLGFIANGYWPNIVGGAEIVTQTLAEALLQNGTQSFVITLNPDGRYHKDEVNGVPVYRLPTRNVYGPGASNAVRTPLKKAVFHTRDIYNVGARADINSILRKERPDVVNTHNLYGFSVSAWSAAADLGIPIIHTLHDYYLMCVRSDRTTNEGPCKGRCMECQCFTAVKKHASSKVSAVVGCSKYVLEKHLQYGYFPNATRHVIHNSRPLLNGVQTPKTPNKPLRFGFLGRIEKIKGIEVLLRSLSNITDVPWELYIGGKSEPEYVNELRTRFSSESIHFSGYIDPREFYQSIDVLVVPSLWEEPLPGVVYESWEFGVPVVGSQVGGIPEMVQNGLNGFLFEPGNITALESILRRCLSQPGIIASMRESMWKSRQLFLPERQISAFLRMATVVAKQAPAMSQN